MLLSLFDFFDYKPFRGFKAHDGPVEPYVDCGKDKGANFEGDVVAPKYQGRNDRGARQNPEVRGGDGIALS